MRFVRGARGLFGACSELFGPLQGSRGALRSAFGCARGTYRRRAHVFALLWLKSLSTSRNLNKGNKGLFPQKCEKKKNDFFWKVCGCNACSCSSRWPQLVIPVENNAVVNSPSSTPASNTPNSVCPLAPSPNAGLTAADALVDIKAAASE